MHEKDEINLQSCKWSQKFEGIEKHTKINAHYDQGKQYPIINL